MLQRMMYVTELLSVIEMDDRTRGEIMSRSTMHIHTKYDWYEAVLQELANATGRDEAAIKKMTLERMPFPESFKYLHLGNPESIVIRPIERRPEEFLDRWRSPIGALR